MSMRAGDPVSLALAAALGLLQPADSALATQRHPEVRLTSPDSDDRRAIAPATFVIKAKAKAASGRNIVAVEFFADGQSIGRKSSAPYEMTWSDVQAGHFKLKAKATDNRGDSSWSQTVVVRVHKNREPFVKLIKPDRGDSFSAPAAIQLQAVAVDRDRNLARVEFYANEQLVGQAQRRPWRLVWTDVAAGSYVVRAKAIDDLGAFAFSRPVSIDVTGIAPPPPPPPPPPTKPQAYYFIHVDHLDTPRLIADLTGATVWSWYNQEPFGSNPVDQHPSGLGTFEFPLRFIGTYEDSESNLRYNWHRYADPGRGQYLQSDPIGLKGGSLSTYVHVGNNPLQNIDPDGLKLWLCVRSCCGGVANHAYLYDDDTGKCCGDPGPTLRERDYIKSCKESGPGKDTCWLISSTPSDAEKALKCCDRRSRGTFYIPGYDDCQNRVDDCIRELQMAPPNTPSDRRFMRCNSCFRK